MSKQRQETEKPKLNEVIIRKSIRKNGSRRIQQDFENCPTMAEQHTAHLTDINYLIQRYKPDELAAYIAVRTQHRQEIIGHDFSREPDMQEGLNVVAASRANFNKLPDDVKQHFKNHVEFLKFIDNPANAEKMIRLGLLEKQDIENIRIEEPAVAATETKRTKDDKD